MNRRIPDEIWIGTENLSPADFLATLAPVVERVIATGRPPAEVSRRDGRFTADRYVAEDSTELWNWPIFPEGFHAPAIMALARLQAWTLKPAVLQLALVGFERVLAATPARRNATHQQDVAQAFSLPVPDWQG